MDAEGSGLAPRDAALLAENQQLHRQFAEAKLLATRMTTDTAAAAEEQRAVLATSRREIAGARQESLQAHINGAQAASDHRAATAAGRAELASSEALNVALQASEGRLRLVLESATDFAIVTIDLDGHLTGWNTGAHNILGWDEAEALGRHARMFWTPEDRAAEVPEAEMRAARELGRADDERWHLRRDGSRFWASGEMMPLRGEDGTLLGFLKILRDRTAQRETERERERLLAMLSQSQTMVCDWDGRVEVWSRGMERLFGYAEAEAIGTVARELLRSAYPEPWPAIIETLRCKGRWVGEARHRSKDGTPRIVQATWLVQPGVDGEPSSLVVSKEDLTAVRQAEAGLREANATLEVRVEARTAELMTIEATLRQAQKMEAVGQLTGGLAHDFNNLLTGISGSLERMQARLSQGRVNDLERYIVVAQGAAKRAAALTHRLLAFSRRQTLDPKPTSVNRLVAGMEELVRRTVGPAITVEVVAAGGLWATLIDPGQLENALLNLCINARDAMPDGGRLTIETGNKWLDQRAARERDLAPGQYMSLCVSDTGVGMTADVIARAFDPFFTTKPIGMGTGLGLSMVYGFAQQSGGQARIYSEPGQGAMVCLYLPRHHGGAESADELDDTRNEVPHGGQGKTVLVVDDEPAVRMLVAEVLEDFGCTVIEAEDGAAGLRVLRSDARIDLLITDVGLPGGLNGRQVADAARAARPGLRVLFITGYAENAVVGNGHLEPGMQVLTKPFAMETLASRIRDLMAQPHEDAPKM